MIGKSDRKELNVSIVSILEQIKIVLLELGKAFLSLEINDGVDSVASYEARNGFQTEEELNRCLK